MRYKLVILNAAGIWVVIVAFPSFRVVKSSYTVPRRAVATTAS